MLPFRLLAPLGAAALALSACATTPYTGPVEVTRFVAPSASELGRGTIAITFPEEIANLAARNAFAEAVRAELTKAGYTVVPEGFPPTRPPRSAPPARRLLPRLSSDRARSASGSAGVRGASAQGSGSGSVSTSAAGARARRPTPRSNCASPGPGARPCGKAARRWRRG